MRVFRMRAFASSLAVIVTAVASGCAYHAEETLALVSHSSDSTGVIVTPIHHMGRDFSAERIYVNGFSYGDAGRGGGGGSRMCCIMLPSKWRPGLVAKVSWTVLDWRTENFEETKKGVHKSLIVDSAYEAEVPVEYYATPETLYVHIFAAGRVRIVSSIYGPQHERHPVAQDDNGERSATAAVRVRTQEDGQHWSGW